MLFWPFSALTRKLSFSTFIFFTTIFFSRISTKAFFFSKNKMFHKSFVSLKHFFSTLDLGSEIYANLIWFDSLIIESFLQPAQKMLLTLNVVKSDSKIITFLFQYEFLTHCKNLFLLNFFSISELDKLKLLNLTAVA